MKLIVAAHGHAEDKTVLVPPKAVVEFLVKDGVEAPGEVLEVIVNSDSYRELKSRRLVQTEVYGGGQAAPEMQFNLSRDPRLVTGVFDAAAVDGSGEELFRMRTSSDAEGRKRWVLAYSKRHNLVTGTYRASLSELLERFPTAHLFVVACRRPSTPPIAERLRRPRGDLRAIDIELKRLVAEICSKHSRTRQQHLSRRLGVYLTSNAIRDRSVQTYPRLAD